MEHSTLAIDTKRTGQRIAQLCGEKGVTVRQLQTLFGFAAPNAIYRWLHGDALPTVDHLVILAHALDVRVDDLLVLRGEHPEKNNRSAKRGRLNWPSPESIFYFARSHHRGENFCDLPVKSGSVLRNTKPHCHVEPADSASSLDHLAAATETAQIC